MKNISVIGVGKLGICFALTLERAGYNILGVDTSLKYVKSINENRRQSPFIAKGSPATVNIFKCSNK